MGATTINGIPYPELTDAPNGPLQMQALANWLEAFFPAGRVWDPWTPTVTQGAGITVTNTRSRFMRYGNTLFARAKLTVGSAGTSGNAITIGNLPAAMLDAEDIQGDFQLFDQSTGINYVGAIFPISTTAFAGLTSGVTGVMGVTGPTVALASGDIIRARFILETAT